MVLFNLLLFILFHQEKYTLPDPLSENWKSLNTSQNYWDFSRISAKGIFRLPQEKREWGRETMKGNHETCQFCELLTLKPNTELFLWTLGAFSDIENEFDSYFWHHVLTSKARTAKLLHGGHLRSSSPDLSLRTWNISQGGIQMIPLSASASVQVPPCPCVGSDAS